MLLIIFIISIASVIFYQSRSPKVQESITFFPIDPNVTFKNAVTSLQLTDTNTVLWKIDSTLDRKAYLRQDAGLLFSNGRLIGKLGEWKQQTPSLSQTKKLTVDENSLLQAITFHHAEIHDRRGQISSAQALSSTQLYVKTKTQAQWKQQLNEQTERMLQYSWNKGVRHFSIHLNHYQAFPLQLFNERVKSGLPGYTKKETERIVGELWEGLYKNYFLGIKKADGSMTSPIGSTLPLILLAKDKTHLLVLTETADKEPILLRQMIEAAD